MKESLCNFSRRDCVLKKKFKIIIDTFKILRVYQRTLKSKLESYRTLGTKLTFMPLLLLLGSVTNKIFMKFYKVFVTRWHNDKGAGENRGTFSVEFLNFEFFWIYTIMAHFLYHLQYNAQRRSSLAYKLPPLENCFYGFRKDWHQNWWALILRGEVKEGVITGARSFVVPAAMLFHE